MRSLDEEMAMLAELADAEERLIAAEKEARLSPKKGLKKGFLLASSDKDPISSPTNTSTDIDTPAQRSSASPICNVPQTNDVIRTNSAKKVTYVRSGPDPRPRYSNCGGIPQARTAPGRTGRLGSRFSVRGSRVSAPAIRGSRNFVWRGSCISIRDSRVDARPPFRAPACKGNRRGVGAAG